MPRPLNSIRRTGVAFASPVQGEVAARKGSRRGVRLDSVGEYRSIVSYTSIAYTPSVTGNGP